MDKINIAVICAFNPNNAGMYSVDKSAAQVFSELGLPHRLYTAQALPYKGARIMKWLRGKASHPRRAKFGTLRYSLLNNSKQYEPHSHIIFWGDFLNNPIYGANGFARRDVLFGHSKSRQGGFRRWQELFVEEPARAGRRVASIGGNFQHCGESLPREYESIVCNVASNFQLLLPRDNYSTEIMRSRADACNRNRILLGLDCAFLLKSDLATDKSESFSYHFGRSNFCCQGELLASLQRSTEWSPVQLSDWFRLRPTTAEEGFHAMERLLATSRFVVTDTYHVSINALRLGVPVFCLGHAQSTQQGTLGDFKKKALFEMLQADDWYFEKQPEESEAEFMKRCSSGIRDKLVTASHESARISKNIKVLIDGCNRELHRFFSP